MKHANRQDSATPFNKENVLPIPDKPGVWFYQATKMPAIVIRKDDGELYFQGGAEGDEEMKVSAFGELKAANEELCQFGFVQLHPIIDMPISAN